ncbi:putative specificity protein s [Vibrio coralliirubri]|uniref:restriction endonuclease subunit S n=1 Tax=Vibrio coralliirubri TaxID=1516159 RepID=UPI00063358BB|nr:restriction endonuclease subunit S [Vibrio coralliirubri]CDT99276.1 putative specificity protein s [Vibrio coralliirubri]
MSSTYVERCHELRAHITGKVQKPQPMYDVVLPQLPAGWEWASLSEIAERVSVGHVGPTSEYFSNQSEGVTFVRSQNVRPGHLSMNGVAYITKEFHRKLKKSQLRTGDILIVRVGANRGDCCVVPENVKELNCANIVFARLLIPSSFFSYYFQSDFGRGMLLSATTGSAQGVINTSSVAKMPVPIPPAEQINKIAAKLGAYDRLIENNSRRISILEEMAQSLYREWFVNFCYPNHEDSLDEGGNPQFVDSPLGQIPNGWEIKSAQTAITINPKTKLDKTTDNPFVGMSGLAENSMVIRDVIQKKGNSGAKFINGDTLFARITPCLQNGKTGYVQFLTEEQPVGFGSTEFIVLRESEDLSSEFIYLLSRSNNFREHAIQSMTGATGRQRVHNDCFASLYIVVPPRDLMDEFKTLVAPMFKSIFNLSKRNENLKKQRDMLLPKLISGGIEL